MITRDDVLELCASYDACDEAMDWLRSQPDAATAEQLLATCKRTDWLLWLAPEVGVGDVNAYVRIACEIAMSVLHLVPEGETRPLAAIELAERSLSEDVTREELLAAHDAACVECAAWTAAGDAARAAAWAARAAAWAAADTAADTAVDTAWAAARAARAAEDAEWTAGAAAHDAARAARAAGAAARALQADIVRKYLPLEMWETAEEAYSLEQYLDDEENQECCAGGCSRCLPDAR